MGQNNYTHIGYLLPKKNEIPSQGKETEPLTNHQETIKVQEIVEKELKDNELDRHVEIKPESVKLPSDLKKIGVQNTQASPDFSSYKNITLPLSDEEVMAGLQEPVSTSKRWISEFAKWLLMRVHLVLKKVHGKVVRVIKH